jgi:DNA-binding MarR family transcriptional regulator
MKEGTAAIQALMEQFVRIVNRYNALQERPYDFGTGGKLNPAEIHTVSAIAASGALNVTELAGRLGVTRGAISQMASRLEAKGLVRKTRERGNDKEVILGLTSKGRRAHEGHSRFHGGMFADFLAMMDGVSPENLKFFAGILDRIEFHINQYDDVK